MTVTGRNTRFFSRPMFLAMCASLSLAIVGSAQTDDKQAKSVDAYKYPVKPGTAGWSKLKSQAERVKALQVPEDQLREMSTDGLVETCLTFPLTANFFAYDSRQKGFETVVREFNGLQELLRREDAGPKLLQRYRTLKVDAILMPELSAVERGDHAFNIMFMETTLAQDSLLRTLSQKDRLVLLGECLNRIQAKQRYPQMYSFASLEATAFAAARVLALEGATNCNLLQNPDPVFKQFLTSGDSARNPVVLEAVMACARELVEKPAKPAVGARKK